LGKVFQAFFMEISIHNVRQVYATSDLVNQSHRGELTHGQGIAPTPTVPDKSGDATKVVLSKDTENLKNDLQEKSPKQPKDKSKKEIQAQEEEVTKTEINPIDVGINLDVNG
jgi:hypothetical protein